MLPILHLNGWKIANPTVLARLPRRELELLFEGYGYEPYFVEGDDPTAMHQLMASTLDAMLDRIAAHPGTRRAPQRSAGAAAVANAGAAQPEGLDRTEGRGRPARPRARGARTRCR